MEVLADDQNRLSVVCNIHKMSKDMVFYSVVYLSELKDPRIETILKHMMEGGEKYVIDDYVPPSRSSRSSLLISLVLGASFLVLGFELVLH